MHILILKKIIIPLALSLFLYSNSWAKTQTNLSLTQAISKALQQHPDLKAYRYQAQAAQGAFTQASTRAPIEANLVVENVLGTGEYTDFSAMQTTISIAWLLDEEIVNTRQNLANAKAQQVIYQRQNKALDVAATTAQFYISLLAQKQARILANLAMTNAELALFDVTKRVQAGRAHMVDQLRAKAHLSKKSLVVEDLNHEIDATKAQLAAQWLGEVDFTVSGDLAVVPVITDVDHAYKQLKKHPRMQQIAVQQRVTRSAIALAKANEKPVWQLNTGIKHHNHVDDVSLMAGISLPLWTENRNRGQIIELQAQQNQRQAELAAWKQDVSTQLLLIIHKLKHNHHVIEGLSKETIPALEGANKQAGDAYRLGNYSYNDWYTVQEELITSQQELITAYRDMHLLNIELERLTGASLQKSVMPIEAIQ